MVNSSTYILQQIANGKKKNIYQMFTAINLEILFTLLCSGRAEINIMPWEEMLRAIKKGNKRIK